MRKAKIERNTFETQIKVELNIETLDEKGNPLANQLLTFNINGIIYKGTTDKFGIIDAIIYVNADWRNTYHICTATFGESFASQTVIVKRFVMG